jgi:hypothetical protein
MQLFNDILYLSKVETVTLVAGATDSMLSSNRAENGNEGVLALLSYRNSTVCASRRGIVSGIPAPRIGKFSHKLSIRTPTFTPCLSASMPFDNSGELVPQPFSHFTVVALRRCLHHPQLGIEILPAHAIYLLRARRVDRWYRSLLG